MADLVIQQKCGVMSERQYIAALNHIVDELMEQYPGTYDQMAKESGVSLSTVYKLGKFITRRPQLRTILKLAKAVGVRLVFDFRVRRNAKLRRVVAA